MFRQSIILMYFYALLKAHYLKGGAAQSLIRESFLFFRERGSLMTTQTNNQQAHELLRQAHNHGYRFPQNFAGFKAVVNFTQNGIPQAGEITIRSPREIALELNVDEEARTWLQRELASLCGHRWYAPYEQGDGRYALELGDEDDHPVGRLIVFRDDPFASSYRVGNGAIKEINRSMGTMKFRIHIQSHLPAAGDSILPEHFTVTFWSKDPQRLTRTDIYHDKYAAVNDIYLPIQRQVITADDSGEVVRRIELSRYELLEGVPADFSGEVPRRPH